MPRERGSQYPAALSECSSLDLIKETRNMTTECNDPDYREIKKPRIIKDRRTINKSEIWMVNYKIVMICLLSAVEST